MSLIKRFQSKKNSGNKLHASSEDIPPPLPKKQRFPLEMDRSPLFARRKLSAAGRQSGYSDSMSDISRNISSCSLRGSSNESYPSKQSLKKTLTLPVSSSTGVFPLSPVVTKILSPQPKDVLVQKAQSANNSSVPSYAEVCSNSSSSGESDGSEFSDSKERPQVRKKPLRNRLQNSKSHSVGTPMSPFYPITPLTPGSPFLSSGKSPIFCPTPANTPQSGKAVVFENFESLRDNSLDYSGFDNFTPKPHKVVTRDVSVTPYDPVDPIDISCLDLDDSSNDSSSAKENMSGKPSILTRPLPPIPPKNNRPLPQPDPSQLYQTVVKKVDSVDHSIVSRNHRQNGVDESTFGNSHKEAAAILAAELKNMNTKSHSSVIQMVSNNPTLSLLPNEEIEKLFKESFLRNVAIDAVKQEEPPSFKPGSPVATTGMSLDSMVCAKCGEGFEPQEKIVNSNGQLYHVECFVCCQCFRPFPNNVFYEFEGRRFCEHDFQVLFAPCCAKCNEFIVGRVIKAMNQNWHPQCFTCSECNKELADLGFIKYNGRAVCHDCNAMLKSQSQGKYMCHKCHVMCDGTPLRWRGDTYCPYHFNCTNCGVELTHQAREVKSRPGYTANQMNELYCLRCHDKMGIPICGACRRPIEERVVTALGKHWHVEHFVCAKCEKPFLGNRHYEKKGQAYCELHYHELFGNLCFVCNQVIYGDVVTALNKAWCVHHFACTLCDTKMTQKTKFFEFDQKPICKKCYEKLPQELKKRLKKQHDIQARGGRPAVV